MGRLGAEISAVGSIHQLNQSCQTVWIPTAPLERQAAWCLKSVNSRCPAGAIRYHGQNADALRHQLAGPQLGIRRRIDPANPLSAGGENCGYLKAWRQPDWWPCEARLTTCVSEIRSVPGIDRTERPVRGRAPFSVLQASSTKSGKAEVAQAQGGAGNVSGSRAVFATA